MGSIIRAITKVRAQVISQSASLVFLNVYLLRLRSICIPALNCHSCPAAVFACPIGVLVNFAALRVFPFVAIGILGFVGSITGRLACGWLCPFGFIQDGLYKIPSKKFGIPRRLGYTKYVALLLMVAFIPFFFPESLLVFCRVCPAGTLESAIQSVHCQFSHKDHHLRGDNRVGDSREPGILPAPLPAGGNFLSVQPLFPVPDEADQERLQRLWLVRERLPRRDSPRE
jgi:hypothetical protein